MRWRAPSGVAGRSAASVRNTCRAMTLLLYLLMSRTISASAGDSCVAIPIALGGVWLAHRAGKRAAELAPERVQSLDLAVGRPRREASSGRHRVEKLPGDADGCRRPSA